jgi:hypothetical protein
MNRCLASQPNFALAHLFKAFALNKLGSTAESQKSLERAYELDPGLKAQKLLQPGKK